VDNGVAGGVGCGVGFTITTFGNGGTPMVEAVVVAGANNAETVVEGTGDGLAISMAHAKTSGREGRLRGKGIFSGRMWQMIFPAGNDDRGLGETIVSKDGIDASG
jgi:hypothetical protein